MSLTSKEVERGVEILLKTPLIPVSTNELATEMQVAWETAKKHRAYLEGIVEAIQEQSDVQIAPRFSAARELCLSAALQPDKLAKASTKDLMIGAGIADDHWRLASGKSTSNVHILQEITTREQLASRFKALGLLDVGVSRPSTVPLGAEVVQPSDSERVERGL